MDEADKINKLGEAMAGPSERFFDEYIAAIKDAGLDVPQFETGLVFGDSRFIMTVHVRTYDGPDGAKTIDADEPAPIVMDDAVTKPWVSLDTTIGH